MVSGAYQNSDLNKTFRGRDMPNYFNCNVDEFLGFRRKKLEM